MGRVRIKRLSYMGGAYLLVIALAVSVHFARTNEIEIIGQNCMRAPNSECLAYTAANISLRQKSVYGSGIVRTLIASDQTEIAKALAIQLDENQRRSHNDEKGMFFSSKTYNRVWAASHLRSGKPIEPLFDNAFPLEGGVFWYVLALDILGQQPDSKYSFSRRLASKEMALAPEARAIAKHIESLAPKSKRPRIRNSKLRDAAEIYALLGDRSAALFALDSMVASDDSTIRFSDSLIQIVGAELAAAKYELIGGDYYAFYLQLAQHADICESARRYLDKAFELAHAKKFFGYMAEVATTSASLGHGELALQQISVMQSIVHKRINPLRALEKLDIVDALIAANAPRDKIISELTQLENQFLADDFEVRALSHFGHEFSFEHQAIGELGFLFAKLGNFAKARKIFDELPASSCPARKILSNIPLQDAVPLVENCFGAGNTNLARAALVAHASALLKNEQVEAETLKWIERLLTKELSARPPLLDANYLYGTLALAQHFGRTDSYPVLVLRFTHAAFETGHPSTIADAARFQYELIEKGALD